MEKSSLAKVPHAILGVCLTLVSLSALGAGVAPVVQVPSNGGMRNFLYDRNNPGITEYADQDVRAYLTHKEKQERNERASQKKREEVLIEPAGQPAYTYRLEEREQLAELHRYRDRLIVVARANPIGLSTVTVVDWRSGKKLDTFLAIQPSVSPEGRYVAFVRFYQQHGVETVEDQIRVYDMAKSGRENRHGQAPDDDNEEIGIAVHPKAGKDGHVPENMNVPFTTSVESSFAWSADSSEFAALMELEQGRKYFVVRAAGASFAEVSRYDIPDPKAFCLNGYEDQRCGGSLKPEGGIVVEIAPEGVTLKTVPNGRGAVNAQVFRREWFKLVR